MRRREDQLFYRANKDYQVAYPNPIKLKVGDRVRITKRETNPDWLGWVFCVREDNIGGWVSEKYLEISNDVAVVVKDYDATELAVVSGEIVEKRYEEFGWAWVRNREMKEGWVPLSHLATSSYPPVRIRLAEPGDEAEIANAHLNSWREAYKDLLPSEFLNQLPLTFKRRRDYWRTVIPQREKYVFFVAEAPEGIVGFACFRQGTDQGWEKAAELGAMYLLEKYKGSGVGFNLLSAGFKIMQGRGFNRGFCWVLEGNQTIQFYERTGATFSGDTKQDSLGGKQCNELRYEWKVLNFTDYDWKPLLVNECVSALKTFDAPWMFAGGWAIDLFLGRTTRTHSDVDILIERKDQVKLHNALPDWELWVADPPGALRPWQKGDSLEGGIQDIWARKSGSKAWQLQIMLFDSENEEWIFKRDRSIRRKLSEISTTDVFGNTYLNPEIQLLYKSKSRREKDQGDFKNAVEKLSGSQKQWLGQALEKVYGQHEWLADLAGPSNQAASDSIYLVEHDPSWSMKAGEEIRALRQILPSQLAKKVEHTGSTAIPGIKAKPIIDILILVSDITAAQSAIVPIKSLGYQYWDENPDKTQMFFVKGMPPFGQGRTHHILIVEDENVVRSRVAFRDYLRTHLETATQYEILKTDLAQRFHQDREAYTQAKTQFVNQIVREALSKNGDE